ncbi:MAG: conjugal transfer protein precursor [uncultured bacterium]|nr:MAG: conjugal transfer protein precursor [uncultured bacterium]
MTASYFQKFKKFRPLFFSLMAISFIAITVGAIKKAGYHITYSATPSMPQGFYLVVPTKKIERYDVVEFIPPKPVLNFLKERKWVPQSGLIIKYVFAVPGDDVCVRDEAVWVNGKRVGDVYRFYAPEKILPRTKICGKLNADQYLLLSTKRRRSFDGRYFGAISSSDILGRAVPVFITDVGL